MDKLIYYYQIVEKAISKLGLDPQRTRKQNGKWDLKNGNIPVWVDLWYQESEKRCYYRVLSPFMDQPTDKNPDLAWKLLAANNEMFGTTFACKGGKIFILAIREAEGLDVSEAFAMLMRVGNYTISYRKRLLGIDATQTVQGSAKSDQHLQPK